MNASIRTIPHREQRYETVGDFWTDRDGVRQFRVSAMGNPDFEFLIALHELVESHLCQKRGIPDGAIDAFDKTFEIRRMLGQVEKDAEPGNDPTAPYWREHQFATAVEMSTAKEMGVDWEAYNRAVMSLSQVEPKTHGGHLGATEGA